MKQYLTPEQTAKLIELGFEKPRALVDKYYDFDAEAYVEVKAYSIGELIEMLPTKLLDGLGLIEWELTIDYNALHKKWVISYNPSKEAQWYAAEELIDALFGQLVKLKEAGVI